MTDLDDDSGVVAWRPPLEAQMAYIEQRRLTYGQISASDLKRRCPDMFEPSIQLLFRQLIEAEAAVENARKVLAGVSDHQLRRHCRYRLLAAEHNANGTKRKVEKALMYYGFDEITDVIMRLAREDYKTSPNSLGNYIVEGSPMVREFLAKFEG